MDKNLSSALRKTNIASREKEVIRPSVNKHSFYKEHGSGVHVTAWTTQCLPHFSCVETASCGIDHVSINSLRRAQRSFIRWLMRETRTALSSRRGENNTALRNGTTHRQQEII